LSPTCCTLLARLAHSTRCDTVGWACQVLLGHANLATTARYTQGAHENHQHHTKPPRPAPPGGHLISPGPAGNIHICSDTANRSGSGG
jgi:hypothetical protein